MESIPEEDFDHYEAYRAVYTEESYTLIKKTTETTYTDKNLKYSPLRRHGKHQSLLRGDLCY